jgi:hypothetical protein
MKNIQAVMQENPEIKTVEDAMQIFGGELADD